MHRKIRNYHNFSTVIILFSSVRHSFLCSSSRHRTIRNDLSIERIQVHRNKLCGHLVSHAFCDKHKLDVVIVELIRNVYSNRR
jgi:hypothetical protein